MVAFIYKIKERGSSPAHKTKNAQQIRAVMAFFGVTRMFRPCHVGLAPRNTLYRQASLKAIR